MTKGTTDSGQRPAGASKAPRERRVLYHGRSRARFDTLVAAMATAEGAELSKHLGLPILSYEGERYRFLPVTDVDGAQGVLGSSYVSLVVVDLCGEEASVERCHAARRLFHSLDRTDDRELRYGFHRILVLLPEIGDGPLDDLLLELGNLGIRHTMRLAHEDDEGTVHADGGSKVLRRISALVHDRDPGPTALVANGGGITGIYFELGALKCLDDCLGPGGVNLFDQFYGISAGAVITALLSVGYTVDEQMAAIAGVPGGRIPAMSLSLLRFGHLNLVDQFWRWRKFTWTGLKAVSRIARGKGRGTADDLFLEWTSLVGAPFQSDGFEAMLRERLEVPGGTNRFQDLPRKLYVGASDQDARRAVLFGAPGYDMVPISKAVQASLSINPAFSGVRIGDRFYEDGAITRTSNYVEAIENGARLLMVLDPFVPYVSKKAGANNRRGMLYNVDQDIRTMSFTRFESTRDLVLRKHPDVSSYTFLPANSQRKLLSVNPMDHRPYLPIWRAAYLSTLQRIEQLQHRLGGDLAARGRSLDISRAVEVAQRLRRQTKVDFADFFPNRRVELAKVPLIGEGAPAGSSAVRRTLAAAE